MSSIKTKKNVKYLLQFDDGKKVTRLAAFGIVLVVGYFQYMDSYHFPKWKVFLSGVIMGAPFSLGIFLSTLPFGKRFKFFTSILILFSAIARALLLVPPPTSLFIFVFVELYAIVRLLFKREIFMKNPLILKDEARDEAYAYFDKKIRPLLRDASGKIDPSANGLENNDVDAFRHAYVSAVFTQEYGETSADIFGRLNEMNPIGRSRPGDDAAVNMDLWNNAVGRKYGLKAKNRNSLLKMLNQALKNGELILTPKDKRKYEGIVHSSVTKSKPIIVLHEEKKGRNEVFFDVEKGKILTVDEFISLIEAGEYPGYAIKAVRGKPTPVSKPDSHGTNNLG